MAESSIQSSFIPHDAEQAAGARRGLSVGFGDLLVILSIVLLVASLVLGVGVFLYERFLETSITSKTDQLERAKAAFEPALIVQLTRLDDRMRDADLILANHIAPSVFLHMLEQATLTTVSFGSLDFEASDPQNMTITMNGIAESVNSIALQADLFSKNGVITSPIFSNIDREQGGVHFSLSALVNPTAIRYLQSQSASQAASAVLPSLPLAPSTSQTPSVPAGSLAPSPSPSPSPSPASAPQQAPAQTPSKQQ